MSLIVVLYISSLSFIFTFMTVTSCVISFGGVVVVRGFSVFVYFSLGLT